MALYNPGSGGRALTDIGMVARIPMINDKARKNFKWFTHIPLNRVILGRANGIEIDQILAIITSSLSFCQQLWGRN